MLVLGCQVMLSSFLLAPGLPAAVVYLFAVVVGLGTGWVVVMMYAIFPDIPDVDELARRAAGGLRRAYHLPARSPGLAIFAVSQTISWAGYDIGGNVVEGATRLVEQPQSATSCWCYASLHAAAGDFADLHLFFAAAAADAALHARLNAYETTPGRTVG
jgi:Na+/melibiose symporter-like transporter